MTTNTISTAMIFDAMQAYGDLGYKPTTAESNTNGKPAEGKAAIAQAIGAALITEAAAIDNVTNAKGYTYVKINGKTAYIYATRKTQGGWYVAITDRFLDKYPADVWGWEYHSQWSPKWATVMTDDKLAEFAEAVKTGSASVRFERPAK